MQEEWRAIDGTNGRYEVSNTGKIRSNNYLGHGETKELKLHQDPKGYLRVRVYKGNTRVTLKVHRAVAQAFIPNPKNLPEVNHINGIKNDNSVENLEWCTASDNEKHAYRLGLKEKTRYHSKMLGNTIGKEMLKKAREKRKTSVKAIEIKTGNITYFSSQADAARETNTPQSNIFKVMNHKRKSANGYVFEYADNRGGGINVKYN